MMNTRLHDQDWRQRLTAEQFRVLRQKGTEAPFSGEFVHHFKKGIYTCAGCGAQLFSGTTKFDAHCGWPSFYDVLNENNVNLIEDSSHGMQRVEVVCASCGGHLGHVFMDAPEQPTGLRYCINSVSLQFESEREDGAKAEA